MGSGKPNSGQFEKGQQPWNKGKKTGLIPWNKGKPSPMKGKHRTFTEEWKRNLSKGHKGKKLSEETKKKIGDGNRGKKLSEETKQKISKIHTGMKHTEKTRKKLSIINKGRTPWNLGLTKETDERLRKQSESEKGKKVSEETRKKIRASSYWKGKKGPMYGRKHSEQTKKLISKIQSTPEWHKKSSERRRHQVFPPKDAKSTEKPLQKLLKENKIDFKKHKPILGIPDAFIEPNICIFADGDYWHGWKYLHGEDMSKYKHLNDDHFEKIIQNDKKVTEQLKKDGYNVLRFWEHEIKKDPEKCLQKIIKAIKESKQL